MRIIIVSGRSGSGKTVCLHVLEDMGYYCIDNLPLSLLPQLPESLSPEQTQLAISIDARNLQTSMEDFPKIVEALVSRQITFDIFYLDADDETLLRRFSESRRRHPLATENRSLAEALQQESVLLSPLQQLAKWNIDTQHLSMYQLRDRIHAHLQHVAGQSLSILFLSFGYKSGLPKEADLVFDVRCLANPYWEPGLSGVDGRDSAVIQFLENQPRTARLLADITGFLERWIPSYAASNRAYLTVAIGCTGGQHRSVYMAEKLGEAFRLQYPALQVRHREL